MSYQFNADDVFSMAEQMEKNGASFYKTAAEGIADGRCRKLLLRLAAMEAEHERSFKDMRSELNQKEKTSNLYDPEGESMRYLRALVNVRVFFEKKIEISSREEILKAAVTAEKDSIVFYLGMKEMVPEKAGKSRIDAIIQEEMDHIRLLSEEIALI